MQMKSKTEFMWGRAYDWPCVLLSLSLLWWPSSRCAGVNMGRVLSNSANWKAFFFIVTHYHGIPHLTMLAMIEKKRSTTVFAETCLHLWPDETSISEPYLTRCGLPVLGNKRLLPSRDETISVSYFNARSCTLHWWFFESMYKYAYITSHVYSFLNVYIIFG